jgi:hypothetical protein
MRLVLFAFAVLALAGCGTATTAPGFSGESPTLPQPPVSTGTETPDLKAPPILLISAVGKQRATEGSSCVTYVDPDTGKGAGACGDTGPIVPEAMTVVQPGDNVIVTIPGAKLKRDSSLVVRPLGCERRETRTLDLPATGELHWPVDLEPGPYQLDVFALFEADSGLSGDVTGSLGLLVGGNAKENDYRGIVSVDLPYVCPPLQP